MINSANDFTNSLKNYENSPVNPFRMATVTEITDGVVFLTFYGEDEQREKSYKKINSYSPSVGDTVICAKSNNTYVILGKVV